MSDDNSNGTLSTETTAMAPSPPIEPTPPPPPPKDDVEVKTQAGAPPATAATLEDIVPRRPAPPRIQHGDRYHHHHHYDRDLDLLSIPTLPSRPQMALNVKFAPAARVGTPETAIRRSRWAWPRALSSTMSGLQDPEPGPQYSSPGRSPMWTEEELAEARMRQVAAAMEKERKRREAASDNDALVVFGQKLKDASRQIWKKMSKKDLKEEKENIAAGEEGFPCYFAGERQCFLRERSLRKTRLGGQSNQSDSSTSSSTPASSTPSSSKPSTPIDAPLRSILIQTLPLPEDIVPEEEEEEIGGVWEEGIDPDFPLNASQAESAFDTIPPSSASQSKRRSIWQLDYQPPDLGLTGLSHLQQTSESSMTNSTTSFSDDCTTPTGGIETDATSMTPTIQSSS
ncbi:hypothetical protein DFP72DRAFT_1136531 [Ephemerocybe angulata]|uniref:Uncharacterized protein n=1 Tax=Ephemerocybe angulata TaxID=980116 RepID=A0A8H6IDX4_9AGAR|nr:hypothetical protein DFP72DRAFT_1136531 [Tulosesus angulatus]